jgi:hypothetical protein
MYSCRALASSPPPLRVSQVPRSRVSRDPRALSTTTPGGLVGACGRSSRPATGFTTLWRAGHCPLCVTRPNLIRLRYGSRVRSAGLRRGGLLRSPPASLPVVRAINRIITFQIIKSARLCLAHQRAQRDVYLMMRNFVFNNRRCERISIFYVKSCRRRGARPCALTAAAEDRPNECVPPLTNV